MGDFSYELPSQPAIDAAAQASFHFDDTFSANQIKIARQPIKERLLQHQSENLTQLIEHMKREGYINSVCYGFYGHRDKGNTVCPGDPLYALWGDWENWHREC